MTAYDDLIQLLKDNKDVRRIDDIRRVWPELLDKLQSLISTSEGTHIVTVTEPKPTKYEPTADEKILTPKDGMVGGISWFGGPKDQSTYNGNMGLTGEPGRNPKDDWYCAMRFGYVGLVPNPAFPAGTAIKPADNIGLASTEKWRLKALLPSRRLKVTNNSNGKSIVVRPADWGPGIVKPFRVIDVSEHAIKQLGASTDTQVTVEWIDPKTPLGPLDT